MIHKINQAFQFKVSLDNSKPLIWRRIIVPSTFTFWEFHCAIQDAMGWFNYHLNEFELKDTSTKKSKLIGLPDEDGFNDEVLMENKEVLHDYFDEENTKAKYMYDFGDSWLHTITLEKIIPLKLKAKYPQCTAGKNACPPEDCGGIPGYYYMLKTISDENNEDYEDTIEWLGGEFDPTDFDPKDVSFDDAREIWNDLFPGENF